MNQINWMILLLKKTILFIILLGNAIEQNCKYLQTGACNKAIIKINKPYLSN
jgi:hypothetical protein